MSMIFYMKTLWRKGIYNTTHQEQKSILKNMYIEIKDTRFKTIHVVFVGARGLWIFLAM